MTETNNNIFKEVASKADIVTVVSNILGASSLVKKGKIYLAICPFHHDTHPSMRVDPERNSYKCFSCGEGGDAIRFVQKYENISPLEALKRVCSICNIPVPDSISDVKKEDTFIGRYQKELDALLECKKFYQLSLKSNMGESCRKYLLDRGIDDKTVEKFSLGYAPRDNSLLIESLRKNGFDISTLERAGIIDKSSDFKDRFSNRLIFPLYDNHSRLVGFSGRVIDKDTAGGKYINYPETDLFKKNNILYNYCFAKDKARVTGKIYIVEGFMDAIAMSRAGIEEVVASMGTAFTKNHIQALKDLNCSIVLSFDSDEPGQQATEKALKLLVDEDISVSVTRKFKGAKDADELFSKSKDRLIESVSKIYDPFLFSLARRLNGRKTLEDSSEINRFINDFKLYYQKLDDIHKARDLNTLSKITLLDSQVLKKMLSVVDENETPAVEEKNDEIKVKRRYIRSNRREDIKVNISNDPLLPFNRLKKTVSYYHPKLDNPYIDNQCSLLVNVCSSRLAYHKVIDEVINLKIEKLDELMMAICDKYLEDDTKLRITSDDIEELKTNFIDDQEGIDELDCISNFLASNGDIYDEKRFDRLLANNELYGKRSTLIKKMSEDQSDVKINIDYQEICALIKKNS